MLVGVFEKDRFPSFSSTPSNNLANRRYFAVEWKGEFRFMQLQELLRVIVTGLVQNPDAIEITEDAPDADGMILLHLHVSPEDMGRVIGKQGRIAKAVRTVMRAGAMKNGQKVMVEIE